MLIGITINNRGEKDQSGKTGLELFGCLVWLRVQVTNSLTGVECYKWDTTERVLAIPKIILSEDEKARLIRYFGVLIKMDRGQSDQ